MTPRNLVTLTLSKDMTSNITFIVNLAEFSFILFEISEKVSFYNISYFYQYTY